MTQQMVIDIGFQAIMVSMKLAAPALVTILIVGFLVSIFQAATQINEQTLSFIPKIIAMTIALMVTGPWILQTIIYFTKQMFDQLVAVTK